PLAPHVDDERTAVDGAPLEIEELIEASDAPRGRALEEDCEYLCRDARVGERAVPADATDAERPGHGIQRAAAELGHEPPRELERAERGQVERPAGDQALRLVQKTHVEAGVVRDQHPVAREGEEAREGVLD